MTWEYLEVRVEFSVARGAHRCKVVENGKSVESGDWIKDPKKHKYWENSYACANHYAMKGWELMKMDKQVHNTWYFFKRQN